MCPYLPLQGKQSFMPNHLYTVETKRGYEKSVAILLLKIRGLHWHSNSALNSAIAYYLGKLLWFFLLYLLLPFFLSWLPALVCLQGLVFVQLFEPAEAQCP